MNSFLFASVACVVSETYLAQTKGGGEGVGEVSTLTDSSRSGLPVGKKEAQIRHSYFELDM